MRLTDTAIAVLERRYVTKDEAGKATETAYELFDRVATAVAAEEAKYGNDVEMWKDTFYQLMTSMSFLPNSPTLMNAGTPDGQLSACFVLPIEDSMVSIFNTLRDAVLIHKTGGGTGFSVSRIRPSNSIVRTTGGVASGPVSFMFPIDAATETVKQGGKRRGGNMGTMRCDHPNIIDFITCKRDKKSLRNFNISVGITNAFMHALLTGAEYDLVDPFTKSVSGTMSAAYIWDLIATCAWETGEPGIIFLDRINEFNPTPELGLFESTNPCGEQPLLPYESCNLGSMNLASYYDLTVMSSAILPGFDMVRFRKDVVTAVRFLDNVIDANKYPLPEITEATLKTRKIGLGVMGFADLLFQLGIPYDSEEGIEVAMIIMRELTFTARRASKELGHSRGNFPAIKQSIWKDEPFMRHAAVSTIAPTGTISMIANVSSGVEPSFGLAYVKNVMDDDKFVVVNEVLASKILLTDEMKEAIAESGSIQHSYMFSDSVKRVYKCAHDITPEWHINMQAAFQQHTDNAISKTINFPSHATKEDIEAGYLHAWHSGCKGTTVYRDGSLEGQTITFGTTAPVVKLDAIVPRERGKTTRGFTDKVATGCGNLYVTVNFDDHGICEVFTNTGKGGGCASQSESAARLATVALRADVDHGSIVKQLKGIRCASAVKNPNSECLSCPDAIAKVIAKASVMLGDNTHLELGAVATEAPKEQQEMSKATCPDCSADIAFGEGCVLCPACGYSKCN